LSLLAGEINLIRWSH